MNCEEVKKERLKKQIDRIDKSIHIAFVKNGRSETCVYIPDDLYEDIEKHVTDKGFKISREEVSCYDMDGFRTGEYSLNYYISLK